MLNQQKGQKLDVQNGNFEDFVAGDKHVYAPLSPIEKAIKSIQAKVIDSEVLQDYIEDLAELINDNPDREIIGVEEKLRRGGRSDLIANALRVKNKFAMRICKRQMSLAEQRIYTHVLALIITSFEQNIRPLIAEGEKPSVVDAVIYREIIAPIYQAIVGYDETIDIRLVQGMLYFLTGKCHIVWSEQC